MKCVICKQGRIRKGTSTVTLERHRTTLVFKQVPALICENCGESYLDQKISAKLFKKALAAVQEGVQLDIRAFKAA